MFTNDIQNMLDDLNIKLTPNIIADITFYLQNCKHVNNHVSFIVNAQSKHIILYKFNIFYNSKTFPYSSHSEIEGIKHFLKNYRQRQSKTNSKILFIVIKITRTGKIGNSKPCKFCASSLYNHFNNMNLKSIFYSHYNELIHLNKENLLSDEFKLSAGFSRRII